MLSYHPDKNFNDVIDLVDSVPEWRRNLCSHIAAFNVAMLVKSTKKLEGAIAELGVFRGATARVICEYKGNRTLHLFDTSKGLPAPDEIDDKRYYEGRLAHDLKEVGNYLKDFPNVVLHEGLVEDTLSSIKNERLSFVHIDLDQYGGTKSSLEFVYPLLVRGGAILVHDYPTSSGVKKACDDFVAKNSAFSAPLPHNHLLIVKV